MNKLIETELAVFGSFSEISDFPDPFVARNICRRAAWSWVLRQSVENSSYSGPSKIFHFGSRRKQNTA